MKVKKSAIVIWLCLIILVGLVTKLNAQHAGENRAETERKKLSVMLMVKGTVRSLEKQPIDTESLYEEINGKKRQHQEKDQSRSISKTHIEIEFNDNLRTRLENIFKAAGLKDIDPEWCQKSEAEALEQSKSHIQKNLAQNFDGTFNKVRTKVVKEQEAKIEKFATPETPQDYLNVEKKSPELHTDLMKRSIKLYSEPLFSENKEVLSNKIRDIIKEAYRQFDAQRSIVTESQGVGDRDITVDSIQQALLDEIKRFMQQEKNPYKIFPSVQDMVLPASQQIASSKFDRWVASWRYLVPFEEIQREISENCVRHRQKSQSKKALLTFFRPDIQNEIFGDYLGELSPHARQVLRRFLEKQPAFENQISLAVEKSLEHFRDARERVSNAQFKEHFPTLDDNTWKLNETAIQRRYRKDTAEDNKRIVQELLTGKQVIVETDQLVAAAVANLAGKGDTAIKDQMSLADSYRAEAEKNIEQLFSGIADTELGAKEFINNLVTTATAEIQQSWSTKALAIDYPKLFQMVKNKIRQDIKDLMPIELERRKMEREAERRAREVEEKRKKEEKQKELERLSEQKRKEEKNKTGGASSGGDRAATGPGIGTGDGPGKGKDKGSGGGGGGDGHGGGGLGIGPGDGAGLTRLEPDVIIDIDIVKKKMVRVSVKLIKGKPYEFTFPLGYKDFNKYRAMIKSGLKAVEERFKDYLSEKAQKQGIEQIYIFTRVYNIKVPYGIVYDLRESVRNIVMDLKIKEKHILWYDGFFMQKGPISERIRKRSSSLGTE